VAADLNGDGFADLAVREFIPDAAGVLLNRGDGTFKPATTFPTGDSPLSVALGDVNKDSRLDIVVGNGDAIESSQSTVSVLLGNGDGTFQPKTDFLTSLAPTGLALADFNRDRKLDIATLRPGPGILSVLLGNGNGTFQVAQDFPVTDSGPTHLAVADLNNDRLPDVVVTDYEQNGNVRVFLNDGTWTAPAPPVTWDDPGVTASAAVTPVSCVDAAPETVATDTRTTAIESVAIARLWAAPSPLVGPKHEVSARPAHATYVQSIHIAAATALSGPVNSNETTPGNIPARKTAKVDDWVHEILPTRRFAESDISKGDLSHDT
jgi:hypothetical protein